jgi:hypothetical protein
MGLHLSLGRWRSAIFAVPDRLLTEADEVIE